MAWEKSKLKHKAILTLYDNGFSAEEIKTVMGYTDFAYANKILRENGKKIEIPKTHIKYEKTDWYDKVIGLRKQGLTYVQIEKELGLSRETVRRWVTSAGLNKRKNL